MRTNVGRRLEVLVALMESEATTGDGLGVVTAAEAVAREKTQISRALRSLADAGLVERDTETLAFLISPLLLRIAARAGDPGLLSAARPVLEHLALLTGERAHLSVLRGGEVLTVDTVAAPASVQAIGWVGRATPVHATAAGMALLAEHDEGAVRELVGDDPLPPAGPAAPGTLAELLARLDAVRAAGIAVTEGVLEPELVSIAAPIRDASGSVVAAVNVSGPGFRLGERVAAVTPSVLLAAREVSAGAGAAAS